jgi:large subunit ribosomal protein L32
MAVQKSRKSHSKKCKRRSQDKLPLPVTSVDNTSGTTHRRHHLAADGFYKGRQVVVVNKVISED